MKLFTNIFCFLDQTPWKVLDWPTYRPELNGIEIIWAMYKKRLRGQVATWENSEGKVMKVWNNISPEIVLILYPSYEKPLVKVL